MANRYTDHASRLTTGLLKGRIVCICPIRVIANIDAVAGRGRTLVVGCHDILK